MIKKIIGIYIFLLLTSCAHPLPTPYQPFENNGGFISELISPGKFKLSFMGNAVTELIVVESYWLKRANELCKFSWEAEDVESGIKEKIVTTEGGAIRVTKKYKSPYKRGIIICNSAKT